MRYIVIGAGGVGGTIGASLHATGHEVVLVARGAHGRALATDGLTLLTPNGTSRHRIPVVNRPEQLGEPSAPRGLQEDDVLILAVKGQDTAGALDAWAHVPVSSGGTAAERLPVFLAQNGVANEPHAARVFADVHAMCLWLPTTHLEPGVVVAEGTPVHGVLHVGRWPDGVDDVDRQVAADLEAAGFAAPVRADVMRWKFAKLLANLGNAVEALAGDDPDSAHLAAQARTEGEAALAAAGISWATPDEEAALRPSLRVGDVPGHSRLGGSSWQSLRRGTGSIEADFLNGEIVMLGKQHGVPTPVNGTLTRWAGRAARTGQAPGSCTVEQLRRAATAGADAPAH
ncbi:ketopantoate reductase family protein [Ruania halotolerans]|uniref:ketopantoate reductase family protein n=1 Tax=Ruania halotolerans TaxID=2897773 RepID=UPI001E5952F7|nr:2-dehydropantoate 2-reductase N-terminal domain-containing protein [Ruania halotolerans]UFU05846.1 ketopantoate reductase family protein [Ruania halotolerans]